MKRRIFLRNTLTLLGSAVSATAFGQMMQGADKMKDHKMGGMGHMDGMDMSHMDHGEMNHGSMMLKEGYQLGDWRLSNADIEIMNQADKNLMDPSHFPAHQALPTLTALKNESDEFAVFKGTLRANVTKTSFIEGVETTIWGYNGITPGPMIEVFEGDWVEITVINELPEATTVHWHGILVPPSEDGNPQDAIPAGESRIYRFRIPEETAGTYWYHPHGHGTVASQVFKGLAGAFIVRRRDDLLTHYPEKNLFISDLKLNRDGSISNNSFFDWMNGREGQFTLINGAYQPTIEISEATRLRIWNATSSRSLNLDFSFAECYLIATDGGLIEAPVKLDQLLLTPAERIEVIIIPNNEGKKEWINRRYDRHKMGPNIPVDPDYPLATFALSGKGNNDLPKSIRTLPIIPAAKKVQRIEYTEEMNSEQMLFLINGKMHDMNRNDLTAKVGEWEEWIVFNNSHMDHNFHIHGTQFRVIEHQLAGVKSKPEIDGLRDTINLRPYETIRLSMKQEWSGLRMFHCHILEHESLGMMGQLKID